MDPQTNSDYSSIFSAFNNFVGDELDEKIKYLEGRVQELEMYERKFNKQQRVCESFDNMLLCEMCDIYRYAEDVISDMCDHMNYDFICRRCCEKKGIAIIIADEDDVTFPSIVCDKCKKNA